MIYDACHKCGPILKMLLFLSFFQFQFKEIVLTEEEKRLLSKEGVSIPTCMPLTKVTVFFLFFFLLNQFSKLFVFSGAQLLKAFMYKSSSVMSTLW